ncbi:MAG: hypothetical protein D6820_14220 [Lentisphaerae bacterium]|nr:MAG: hypothetical protein D6820_14220 [Lentisphaerota bacterium]
MDYQTVYDTIFSLPVFDTHTHLETCVRQCTQGLYARNFFDICRYFWFRRELEAAGYPFNKDEFPEDQFPEEAKILHEALQACRNTYWTRIVMEAMEHLYGIRPDSVDRILELSAVMKKNQGNPQWGSQVCEKMGIKKTVCGPGSEQGRASLEPIRDRVVIVPAFSLDHLLNEIQPEESRIWDQVDSLKALIADKVEAFLADGIRSVRVSWPFKPDIDEAVKKEFSGSELTDISNLKQYLGHYLFELFEKNRFTVQIFFGMQSPQTKGLSDLPLVRTYALNEPANVARMHNIFEMYLGVRFNLFCASELNSLDMVQAARIYPNVYPGGLWWFNFRRSIYERNMQYRVEALPGCRSSIVASDARCIEWSYIKILLIKKVMAHFFYRQIEDGWLDMDAAVYAARCWLHDTAANLYCDV